MNEIVIHAGISKTGTTSIQNSLFSNGEFLNKHDYEYLNITNIRGRRFVNHSGPLMSVFGDEPEHHLVNIVNNWDPNRVNRHYREQLDGLLSSSDNKRIIISGESLSGLSIKELEKLLEYFDGFKIRVIVFIREPYSSFCSVLQSVTKKGKFVSLNNIQVSGDKYISRASDIIEKFNKAFPGTEFYSFDTACLEGGPVKYFLRILGIDEFTGFNEVRLNDDLSNKLTRLGVYINQQEPKFINHKVNPVRRYFRLEQLEFSDHKFLLTRQEAKQVEKNMEREREEIKIMTGIEFKPDVMYSSDHRLTINEVNTLIDKLTGIDTWLKALIWNYIKDNSDAGTDVQKQLFLSREDELDADILRDTALLWEKKDLNLSYKYMELARIRRPNGQFIKDKIDEYRRKLKIPETR